MAYLSDSQILRQMKKGNIVIKPFFEECLGSNSYDVHLGRFLGKYVDKVLDAKRDNQIELIEIPEEGFVMDPEDFYLGSTLEYTETYKFVPFLEGKSSTGRLSVSIHETAGKGDVGFRGFWTLEMRVGQTVKIYPRMPIGQIFYNRVWGRILHSYDKKANAKYSDQESMPVESRMWKNFGPDPLWRDHSPESE